MLGWLLYGASLAIVGGVSWLWVNSYTPIWPNKKGGGTPPTLPKRPHAAAAAETPKPPAQQQKQEKQQKQKHQKAQPSPPPPPAEEPEALAPVQAPAPPPRKHAASVEKTQPASAAEISSSASPSSASASAASSKKEANLLAMAMHAPPVPSRPMLNIMHAPTMTESFSPAHTPHPASSPSPSPAETGLAEEKLEAHRKQVAWEMVSSEESYISSLNRLMTCYYTPLKAKADKGSAKISKEDFTLLFSNVEPIWRFHQLLLPALKTCPDGNVAETIEKFSDYLKMYTKFVGDYGTALNTINKLYKSEDFSRFLKKQRDNSEASGGMDLMSFLIMPVQRVPRYLLLLKELQKYTPASHPHSASISSAIAKISKIALHINETQRQLENASTLLELQHQIHQLPDHLQLFEPHRRLVRHGIVKVVKQEGTATAALTADQIGKDFMVILFNDLLLYTNLQHDFRGMLKLQSCVVNIDGTHVELVRPKSQSYRVQSSLRLECPSVEEARKWNASLKESVANANELFSKDESRRSAMSMSGGFQ